MIIIEHIDFTNIEHIYTPKETAYTSIEHNNKSYIRTSIQNNNYEWREMTYRPTGVIFLRTSDEEEFELEELYVTEFKRINRIKKLKRIL